MPLNCVNINENVLHCEMLHVAMVDENDGVNDDDEHADDDGMHVYGYDYEIVNVNAIAVTVKMERDILSHSWRSVNCDQMFIIETNISLHLSL